MPPNVTEDQFWSRFDRSGECWEWTGAQDGRGYGELKWRRRLWQPHRLAWVLTVGPIAEGLFVCHSCDNGLCARVDGNLTVDSDGRPHKGHLWLGTPADNMHDMIVKGRGSWHNPPTGERNAKAKLTATEVLEIRRLRLTGMTYDAIAARYGVQKPLIWKIVTNRIWKHV